MVFTTPVFMFREPKSIAFGKEQSKRLFFEANRKKSGQLIYFSVPFIPGLIYNKFEKRRTRKRKEEKERKHVYFIVRLFIYFLCLKQQSNEVGKEILTVNYSFCETSFNYKFVSGRPDKISIDFLSAVQFKYTIRKVIKLGFHYII